MPSKPNATRTVPTPTFMTALSRLTFGLGIATGVFGSSSPSFSQQCDRCVSCQNPEVGPTCGCETSIQVGFLNQLSRLNKKCDCACVPKLSFAEKILKRVENWGDSFEARGHHALLARCSCSSGGCSAGSCAAAQLPVCGCESCSLESMYPSTPSYGTNSSPSAGQPMSGSIGDQYQIPKTMAPRITAPMESSIGAPSVSPPNVLSVPFEKRAPNMIPSRRLPVDEWPTPSIQSIPPDRTSPRQPLHELPQLINPPSSMPDILIDPFKDDASAMRLRKNKPNISLTSGVSNASKKRNEISSTWISEAPTKLTPSQRTASSVQFDTNESIDPSEDSDVVPSSFVETRPVIIAVRRKISSTELDRAPQVNRIPVPVQSIQRK